MRHTGGATSQGLRTRVQVMPLAQGRRSVIQSLQAAKTGLAKVAENGPAEADVQGTLATRLLAERWFDHDKRG